VYSDPSSSVSQQVRSPDGLVDYSVKEIVMTKKRTFTLVLAALLVMSIFTSSVLAGGEEPPGDEGCTPGFWKNHTNQWVGYTPGSIFPGTNLTFMQALKARGKGSQVLRHGAAALLNVGGVDYSLSESEVLWAIEHGYGGMLEQANEAFCPLGGRAVKWSPEPVDPGS
jgi:hypothetical protein